MKTVVASLNHLCNFLAPLSHFHREARIDGDFTIHLNVLYQLRDSLI